MWVWSKINIVQCELYFLQRKIRSCSFHRFRYVSKKILFLNIKHSTYFAHEFFFFWTMMLFYFEIIEYLNESRVWIFNFRRKFERKMFDKFFNVSELVEDVQVIEKDRKISWENWKLQHVEGSLSNFSELFFHYHWQLIQMKIVGILKFAQFFIISRLEIVATTSQLSLHRLLKSETRKFDFRLAKRERKISIHRAYFRSREHFDLLYDERKVK